MSITDKLSLNKDAAKKMVTDGIVDQITSSFGWLMPLIDGSKDILAKATSWIGNLFDSLFSKFGSGNSKPDNSNTTTNTDNKNTDNSKIQHDEPDHGLTKTLKPKDKVVGK